MLKNSSKPHPHPRFRYLKRQFIVDTALHTVQLFIMRIIGTRWFNEYLPVVQRLLGFLTITAEQNATIRTKSTKPRRRIALQWVRLCAETVEKPYFKRFSGMEKAHRNSIKITVDLWWRRGVVMIVHNF